MARDTFSRTVKEELARTPVLGKSQAYWEAFALQAYLPQKSRDEKDGSFGAEPFVIRRFYRLMKQGVEVKPYVSREPSRSGLRKRGRWVPPKNAGKPSFPASRLGTSASCRRSFLRGAFLARGSISSPRRTHHLEITLPTKNDARHVQSLLLKEGLPSGLIQRRSAWIVYLKDADLISSFLKAVGAASSVLQYEDTRARKSLKSSVQRLVNMDRANVSRAVDASIRQLDDITLIDEARGFHTLPFALRELARARLENPEMSMTELGRHLSVPASKSAVNHRFRRLSKIAEEIRENENEHKAAVTPQ